jgi:hypothetical protein
MTVEMRKQVVYLPCPATAAADGVWTEVFHVFNDSSSQLTQEIGRREAEAEAHKKRETADAMQREYDHMQALKQKALQQSRETLSASTDELGMVQLRRGFLVAQPLISRIIKSLMQRAGWYPDTCDDTCTRIFGSRDGPWDVFSMFSFLLRTTNPNKEGSRNIFGLTAAAFCPDGSDEGAKDAMRAKLQSLIQDIFFVRN